MAPSSDSVECGTDISIARCRELLGQEAGSMTDRDVEVLRQHAHTMAWILIEMYEGHRRNRTGLQLLREIRTENEGLVDQNRASWNRIGVFLMKIEGLRSAQLTA